MTTRTLLTASLFLAACGGETPDDANPGGQFGEETDTGCQISEETALDLDEVSALGISPQEVLDIAEAEHSATLTWADDSTTALTLSVSDPTNARYVTYEYVSSDGAEIDMNCPDVVVIDMTLGLSTDDGAFAESLDGSLVVDEDLAIRSWVELEGLAGGFDPEDFATESFDTVWADMAVAYDESGVSGEISGYGEIVSGSGDDGTVSMTRFDIATF